MNTNNLSEHFLREGGTFARRQIADLQAEARFARLERSYIRANKLDAQAIRYGWQAILFGLTLRKRLQAEARAALANRALDALERWCDEQLMEDDGA